MTGLEDSCRSIIEELIDKCVYLSTREDATQIPKTDVVTRGISDELQAELIRRNNLITGIGCVIVHHHEWTSDGDFEEPVHTQRTYEITDGIHIQTGRDSGLPWLTGHGYGENMEQGATQNNLPKDIAKERSIELIGVEFMSGDIWSKKYSKKRGVAKKFRGFFRKLFCWCAAQDD